MTDEKNPEKPKAEGEKKETPITGKAGFTGNVGEHEIEVAADVTGKVTSPKDPTAPEADHDTVECIHCGPVKMDKDHWNVDCPVAQRTATSGAVRDTAKSTVPAPPAAVSRQGYVD